ncbi:hypothetical protein PN36_12295 [Candidatus Thiomargarita nelsonii]|uniref:Uncharacterized protein n=1 Tax=Candidatus Thiomargarita nelsonii TaxID=1003181 RepID=A0A4E0RSU2_9GAMM|nr:hypothetical protein PN36_12295 [Candidatus Thiomargarita nelsonii]
MALVPQVEALTATKREFIKKGSLLSFVELKALVPLMANNLLYFQVIESKFDKAGACYYMQLFYNHDGVKNHKNC